VPPCSFLINNLLEKQRQSSLAEEVEPKTKTRPNFTTISTIKLAVLTPKGYHENPHFFCHPTTSLKFIHFETPKSNAA